MPVTRASPLSLVVTEVMSLPSAAQNKGSLQGAVFRFEQIDGSYMTTGITGFDGTISFQGSELPYGSYRVTGRARLVTVSTGSSSVAGS